MSDKIKPINLSPSFLSKVLSKGYDYAVGEKLGLFPRKDTGAMSDGRLIHDLISERLGGEKAKIAINTYDSFRTKEARAWRDSQPDDTAIVSSEKLEYLNKIVDRILSNKNLSKYLKANCQSEQTMEKAVAGYKIKGILDFIATNDDYRVVIDWKFVSSEVFDNFSRKALYMNYDLQASVYDYLAEATAVYFCVIENEAPNRIKLFYCTASFLESGSAKFDKALKIIKENNWRQPNFDIEEVDDLVSWDYMN